MKDDKREQDELGPADSVAEQPASISRRAMLGRGARAIPAILTLQSGAALAQTSNLVSASAIGTRDGSGRTLCLDMTSVDSVPDRSNVFDLGDPPYAEVNEITERDYRTSNNNGAPTVTEDEMCLNAGTYHYKETGQPWQELRLENRGVIVSSTALMSFTNDISSKVM
jgi:hypothetical protein